MGPMGAGFPGFAQAAGGAAAAFNPLSLLAFAPSLLGGILGSTMQDPRQKYLQNAAAQFSPENMARLYRSNMATEMQNPAFQAMLQDSARRAQMGNANLQRTLGTKLGMQNLGVVHSTNSMPAVMAASQRAQGMGQFQAQGAANTWMQGAGMGMPLGQQLWGAGIANMGQAMPFFLNQFPGIRRMPGGSYG